jgi:hypothetical protein
MLSLIHGMAWLGVSMGLQYLTLTLIIYYGLEGIKHRTGQFNEYIICNTRCGATNSDKALYQRKESPPNNIKPVVIEILQVGKIILKVAENSESGMGPAILEECITTFILLIIGLYTSTNIAFISFQAPVSYTVFWISYALPCFVLALLAFLRFKTLVDLGHETETELRKVKANLRKFVMYWVNSATSLNPVDQQSLLVLGDEFLENSTIKPCGYFSLNREMASSAVGILLTYFIVLLQFKISESN